MNGFESERERREDTLKFLSWGFNNFKAYKVFAKDETVGEARVWGGQKWSVPLKAKDDVMILLPVNAKDHRIKAQIVYQGPLKPPVKEGDKVGEVRITSEANGTSNTSPLYAAADMEAGGMVSKGLDSVLLGVNSYVLESGHETPEEAAATRGGGDSCSLEAQLVTLRGKFITFEGGEGGGKTTQAALLCDRLKRFGLECSSNSRAWRHPAGGGDPRDLLSGKAKKFGPLGEAVLFYAARESHLELAIRPALERGTWVVCDRFSDFDARLSGRGGRLAAFGHRYDRKRRRRRDAARSHDHLRSSARSRAGASRKAKVREERGRLRGHCSPIASRP